MLESLDNKLDYISRTTKVNAVYIMYHEGSNKLYVGSSGQPGLRTSAHRTLLKTQRHYNPLFQKLYNEHPEFYIVYYTVQSREDAYKLEQAVVDYFLPTGRLINSGTDVRSVNKGRLIADSTREKQRLAKLGVARTLESRRNQSIAQKGKIVTADTRQKMSHAKKGKPQPQHIADMCRERNRLRSRSISINGVIYPSINEGGRQLKINGRTMGRRLNSTSPKWKDWYYV